jgi:ketosteroid isomerase-like protein
MARDARDLARTYFEAWKAKDFATLRGILADDVTFRGPLGSADGADECVRGLQGMSQMMTGVDVKTIVADGEDVITWFELHTKAAPPTPTANWSHVRDGKITRIRVAFDPREILTGGPG